MVHRILELIKNSQGESDGSYDWCCEKKLIEDIERLSQEKLEEVADFVGYLLSKDKKLQEEETSAELDPTKDPLLKFIAGASHGALAKDIDSELYGGE